MSQASIDYLGILCLTNFARVYALLEGPCSPFSMLISPADVRDEIGRFKIWAANIGALQPKEIKTSLEYRLREAPRTRQYVSEFLQDLHQSLSQGNLILERGSRCLK